jgi:hypothetical protein
MNQHLFVKMCQIGVANLGNSHAKAGPMSEAIALGLTCVPRLVFDHFESQSDSPRLNQRLPKQNSISFLGNCIEGSRIEA